MRQGSAAGAVELFDGSRLAAYLQQREGNVQILRRFHNGQSNPTYLVRVEAKQLVLRRKPSGALLPGAHRIEREFRVLEALQATGIPVPKPYLICEDPSVIGSAFYLMEYVEGRVF